jgi:hypothetical protein
VITILGETVRDRFVWFMIALLIVLAFETRAWFRMDREEKHDNKEENL